MLPTIVRVLPLCLLFTVAAPLAAQKPDAKATSPALPTMGAPAEDTAAGHAWRQFLAQDGGTWQSEWSPAAGTPRAIWGSGVPLTDWRGDSLAEARRHADRLLRERADLLGLGDSTLRETIGARMGQTWALVYDQYWHGLPVIGGRADVRVHAVGRVPMFGATLFAIPAGQPTVPQIDELTATALAWQALREPMSSAPQPASGQKPRLVLWADELATAPCAAFLAWEIPVSNVDADGHGSIGRFYIDALKGAPLHWTNDKHDCGCSSCAHEERDEHAAATTAPLPAPINTTVTVMGWTRTGIDALSALVNVPLPGIVLNVPGIGAVTTDANGQFVINIAAAVSITVGALDGRHHAVLAGANAPSGSFTVNPGVAATIQLLTAGATVPAAAHTTATYWIDRVNEYSRSILGNSAELNTADAIVPTVNIASTCNAFYNTNTINFYSAGGGCSNTAFSTVIAHEWGHGLDDRYGGISQVQGLSEGWGDIIGMYLVDSPALGSGFQTAGVALRDGNNTTQYPPPAEVHAAGEVWMGFAWQLRQRLATTLASRPAAITLTNTIVIGSIVADAVDQPGAVREVFIADDNDGNLANGTPHSVDLIFACGTHSLPYPGLPGPANDDCAGAIALANGVNGPWSNALATTSSPVWSCGSGANDLWFTYTASGTGNLVVDTCGVAAFDTTLQVFSGTCGALVNLACNDDFCATQSSLTVPVTAGTYYIRVGGFNGAAGSFSLNVNGPQAGTATVSNYGTGCYTTSKAFYELFATAAAFDLANSGMRLVRSGNSYIAQPGGTYVAPTAGATSLVLTDDGEAAVTLTGSFPYIGGTTPTLAVCSNGFVSTATGNGTGFTPTAAGWLGGTQPRWGTWHDFNPSAASSGAVKFQQIGTVAYITWDGVFSFGTTTPNTMQLQFDLTTGNVTYVWQSVTGTGNAFLVGYAAAAPNTDLGSRDISVTLPGTFRTSDVNGSPLALTGMAPHLGTTIQLTTTNYPASSGLGVQVLSLVGFDPGIDLTAVGMPGCFRYVNTESTNVVIPVGGQTVFNQLIPNNPVLLGLPLRSQTFAFATGANALGLIASNGVAMTVGI